jgi:hypothetical protein
LGTSGESSNSDKIYDLIAGVVHLEVVLFEAIILQYLRVMIWGLLFDDNNVEKNK